jgi:hypothetical protein
MMEKLKPCAPKFSVMKKCLMFVYHRFSCNPMLPLDVFKTLRLERLSVLQSGSDWPSSIIPCSSLLLGLSCSGIERESKIIV